MTRVLAATLLLALALGSRAAGETYVNGDWGYSVTLPNWATYRPSAPPNPNHGLKVIVSRGSYVWVDGSMSDDRSVREAARSESEYWRDNRCIVTTRTPNTLGGEPAEQLALRCPGRAGRSGP